MSNFFSRVISWVAHANSEIDGKTGNYIGKKVFGISGIIEQILQICQDYNGLPDIRTMKLYEIRFFYNPLIHNLVKARKEANKKD